MPGREDKGSLDALFPQFSGSAAATSDGDGAIDAATSKSNLDKSTPALSATVKDLNEKVRQLTEKNSELQGRLGIVDRLEQAIRPGEEDPEVVHKKILDKHDENPVDFINELVEQRIGKVEQALASSNAERVAKDVVNEIDKDYDVDWDKVAPKIVPFLERIDPTFRKQNQKEALIGAMKMAGITPTKRSSLPYVEGPGMSAAEVAKRQRTEEEKYREGIRKVVRQNSTSGKLVDAILK